MPVPLNHSPPYLSLKQVFYAVESNLDLYTIMRTKLLNVFSQNGSAIPKQKTEEEAGLFCYIRKQLYSSLLKTLRISILYSEDLKKKKWETVMVMVFCY